MWGRSFGLALACAVLGSAGCSDSLGHADAAPRPEEPIWSREFPSSAFLTLQLASWPNGDFALFGNLFEGVVALDGFPLGDEGSEPPFVARFDGLGNVKRAWLDEVPKDGYWQGGAFAAEPGGSLYLAAVIVPQPYVGQLGDYVIRKIGADGVVAWSKAFALAPAGGIMSLAVTPDGVLNVFGLFAGTFDFGGGAITARGDRDNFRLRLDANGTFISADTFGDPSLPVGKIALSTTGLIASIRTGDDGSWFVQVLDAGGRVSWSDTFSGYGNPNGGFYLAFIGDDVVVGAGIDAGTDLGDGPFPAGVPHQLAVARFDRTGRLVWKRGFGSDYNAYLSGLAVDAAGDISVCGFVSHLSDETFVFDSVTIPWAPAPDSYEFGFSFVGKLTGGGHARWAQKIVGITTNSYASPVCGVDAAGALLVADGAARESALYVAKYAP